MQDFKLPAGPWTPELVAKVVCGVKDGEERYHSALLINLICWKHAEPGSGHYNVLLQERFGVGSAPISAACVLSARINHSQLRRRVAASIATNSS